MGTLDPTRKSAIILHMNEDHADACLLYARYFADKQQAMSAEMIDVSMSQITLRIEGEVLTIDFHELHKARTIFDPFLWKWSD